MVTGLSIDRQSPGFRARRLRIARLMTRRELARLAGVSLGEVNLLEHGLPVSLDTRRRVFRQLWAGRAARG